MIKRYDESLRRMENIACAAYYDFKGFYVQPNEYVEAGCLVYTEKGLESVSRAAESVGKRYMKALEEAFPQYKNKSQLLCRIVSHFCIGFYLIEKEDKI